MGRDAATPRRAGKEPPRRSHAARGTWPVHWRCARVACGGARGAAPALLASERGCGCGCGEG
jgi:hypothetical protein